MLKSHYLLMKIAKIFFDISSSITRACDIWVHWASYQLNQFKMCAAKWGHKFCHSIRKRTHKCLIPQKDLSCSRFTAASDGPIYFALSTVPDRRDTWYYFRISPVGREYYYYWFSTLELSSSIENALKVNILHNERYGVTSNCPIQPKVAMHGMSSQVVKTCWISHSHTLSLFNLSFTHSQNTLQLLFSCLLKSHFLKLTLSHSLTLPLSHSFTL